MKYLIILLVLVSIVTMSCKKNPTEVETESGLKNYQITVQIHGSLPIDFEGSITSPLGTYPLLGRTPSDYKDNSIIVPLEGIFVSVWKAQSSGTLTLRLIDQADNSILDSNQTSKAHDVINVNFP